MQVDNEAYLKNIESVYSADLMAKNREIAILRAVNDALKSENDSLKAKQQSTTTAVQSSDSANNAK